MAAKSRRKRSTNNKRKKKNESGFVAGEIITWVSLAVGILLLISLFGFGGSFGRVFSDFLFTNFGWIAYAVPFVLFGGVAFLVSNRKNVMAYIKAAAGIVVVVMACVIMQVLNDHGGRIGEAIRNVLEPAVGVIGTYVIAAIVVIICVVIMTGRSVLGSVKDTGSQVYDKAKEGSRRHREASEKRREEQAARREAARQKNDLELERQKVAAQKEQVALQKEEEKLQKEEAKLQKQQDEQRQKQQQELEQQERQARQAKQEEQKQQDAQSRQEQPEREQHKVSGVTLDTAISGRSPEMKEVQIHNLMDEDSKSHLMKNTKLEPEEPEEEETPKPKSTHKKTLKEQGKEAGAAVDAQDEVRDTAAAGTAGAAAAAAAVAAGAGAVKAHADSKDQAQETSPDESQDGAYQYPPMRLLKKGKKTAGNSEQELQETADKLQQILANFGVNVTVTDVSCGPAVTRYELQPEMGVKVSKIVGLADDIKLNLAASDIRIEAPIPGKAAVGIEVPNKENSPVMLRDILESPEFQDSPSKISFGVGRDIGGNVVVADIAKMPHLLIAGATGSGKSVCINTLIMSILYKATPEEVRLIMIDPKVVELSVYNGIPHLMIPVVTDPKKAAGALNWAVTEMDRRYQLFAENQVRDITGYNEKAKSSAAMAENDPDAEVLEPLPQIVIIVDELADLMMVAPGDVETAICRLAQLARAAGLHLVLATQRPSVNVITGLIKANMPSRIAFAVSSSVDSRVIIDMNGAEKLLGKGDMLFYPTGYPKPVRVQCSYVSDEEVQSVVNFLVNHNEDTTYDEEIVEQVNTSIPASQASAMGLASEDNDRDAYFEDAGRLIIEKDKASIGMLQRTFKIGFNRAARIMDQLCEAGVVGGEEGTKPRKILMKMDEFEQYMQENK